ncbi:SIS domain-containing protein [Enterobacteriaceae bacterium H20N1]|uniref:SIS domain-containing protein n=2 Tax=Dryocola boscaweniae TaxID=2925397 RepID=A0A9X3ANK0_9ENTR|nr:SIS domain-containing protein [Dryocola boscaweniae]MCT4702877.1 SIS domain-containing protein [Dryocola boscaweniae]MCT4720045.1 SIS domain-containing protein [Dryocola boscaweniae]
MGRFTPGERKIASFIIDSPDALKELSSQQMAQTLGVSQSAIVKFAQKLGLQGFTKLKVALVEEWGKQVTERKQQSPHLHNDISSQDPLLDVANKLLNEKLSAIRKTTDNLDIPEVEKIIGLLQAARRIQISAIGGSSLVGKDLAWKLMKIGFHILTDYDTHVQLTLAQTLTSQDVMLAISFSGQRKEVLLAAEIAKSKGATVIAITSLQNSALRKLADFTLDTVSDEQRWRSSSISSRTAQLCITDLLFMGLLQLNESEGMKMIEQSRNYVERLT